MKIHTSAIRCVSGAALLLASVMGLACAGDLDPRFLQGGGGGGTGGSTVACDAPPVLASRCGACHTPNNTAFSGLDLTTTSGMAQRLLNMQPTGMNGSMCGGKNLNYLNPGSSPPSGLLLDKLKPMAAVPCGGMMTGLSDTEMTCLTDWAASVTK